MIGGALQVLQFHKNIYGRYIQLRPFVHLFFKDVRSFSSSEVLLLLGAEFAEPVNDHGVPSLEAGSEFMAALMSDFLG